MSERIHCDGCTAVVSGYQFVTGGWVKLEVGSGGDEVTLHVCSHECLRSIEISDLPQHPAP